MPRNDWTFAIGFQKTFDFHVYIHAPGDEVWLSFLTFPFQLVYLRLNSNNTDGINTVDLSISEKEIITLNKEGSQCKSYMEQARVHFLQGLLHTFKRLFQGVHAVVKLTKFFFFRKQTYGKYKSRYGHIFILFKINIYIKQAQYILCIQLAPYIIHIHKMV